MTNETDGNQPKIIIYETDDQVAKVSVRLEGETVWLTNLQLAQLFHCTKSTVSEHIKNIFDGGELSPEATARKFRTVAANGKTYGMSFYNLDMIISLGYRINSKVATQFRQWATARLREYIIKGFTMDDARLKELGGGGYWKELLERIRDIRASERRMYLRVREIFALAGDYDPVRPETTVFFQTIQNKLHFAATGKTAPELIAERADQAQPNMGLTSWKGEVVRKADVTVAKNYLNQDEITELNRIVTMWLDFAEDQARRRKQVFLKDWDTKLDEFLRFNDRAVLPDKGRISRADADARAEAEYEEFAARRRAMLEAEAERQQQKALEDAAKKLPKRSEE